MLERHRYALLVLLACGGGGDESETAVTAGGEAPHVRPAHDDSNAPDDPEAPTVDAPADLLAEITRRRGVDVNVHRVLTTSDETVVVYSYDPIASCAGGRPGSLSSCAEYLWETEGEYEAPPCPSRVGLVRSNDGVSIATEFLARVGCTVESIHELRAEDVDQDGKTEIILEVTTTEPAPWYGNSRPDRRDRYFTVVGEHPQLAVQLSVQNEPPNIEPGGADYDAAARRLEREGANFVARVRYYRGGDCGGDLDGWPTRFASAEPGEDGFDRTPCHGAESDEVYRYNPELDRWLRRDGSNMSFWAREVSE